MGNALVHGDGFTTADLSAVESFSVGTYGEGTAEEQTQTESANTKSQQHAYGRTRNNSYYASSHRTESRYGDYTRTRDFTESITGTTASSARPRGGYQPRIRDRYETRDDRDYHANDFAAYRNDPNAYISDRLHEYESSRRAYNDEEAYNNVYKSSARNDQTRYREAYNKIMSRKPPSIRPDDETIEKYTSVGEIYPADTDMAYVNSQDESQLDPEPPQKVSINQKNKKQQELASTASDVLGSLARLEEEQRRVETQVEDESLEPLQSHSFSTLTRTIDMDTMHRYARQHGISKQQLEQIMKNGQALPRDNAGNKKLEELLRQQQLQEEKLQQQLKELRLQKERLKQLQHRKNSDVAFYWDVQDVQEQEHCDRLAKARENCMPLSPKTKAGPEVTAVSEDDEPQIIHLEDEAESEVVVMDGFEILEDKYVNTKSEEEDEDEESDDDKEEEEERVDGDEEKEEEDMEDRLGKGDDNFEDDSTAGGETAELTPQFQDVPTHCSVDPEAAYNFVGQEALSVNATLQPDAMGPGKLKGTSPLTSKNKHETDREDEELKEENEEGEEEESNGNVDDDDQPSVESFDNAIQEMLSSMDDDDIDLEFVAKYDAAFNKFIEEYSSRFDQDSELVQNLKVAKLQKILEASYQAEADLEAHLESSADMNMKLEADFQQKLRQASKSKAARTIQLQSDVNRLKKTNKTLEGKLTWDLMTMAIKRADRLRKLETSLEQQSSNVFSREGLLRLLPDQTSMYDVKNALKIKPKEDFGPEQQKLLQKLQVDNAFLTAEAKVLEQKVARQKDFAKKQAWIDDILLKLDPKKLEKLKTRYKKQLGVSF